MESNDLMQSLERMKSILSDIKSAKDQVESTVKAYGELSNKVNGFVNSIDKLTGCLSDVVQNIQNDYRGRVNQISSDTEKIISSSNNSIRKLDASISKFNEITKQKMEEQEAYFLNSEKWQKIIFVLLVTNFIIVTILLYKAFV